MAQAKIIVRAPNAYDADAVSEQTGLECPEPTMTNQADAEQTDINLLVKRFGLTGEMPVIQRLPINEDFVGTLTYKDALNAIIEADNVFMELPAEVRQRFNHDAAAFLDFTSDPKNLDELRKMGLAPPAPPVPAPEPPKETVKPVT